MSSPGIGNNDDRTQQTFTIARTANKTSIVSHNTSSTTKTFPFVISPSIFPVKSFSLSKSTQNLRNFYLRPYQNTNNAYRKTSKYDIHSNSKWFSSKKSIKFFISLFMSVFLIESSKALYISSFLFIHTFFSLIFCKSFSLFNRSFHNFFKSIPFCSLLVLFVLFCTNDAGASEFPERECCDPIYPVVTSTSAPPPSAVTVPAGGKPGLNVRTSIAILNCLLARQLCFEDASCSAILEIIPRVCGSELVACSTVTVTKCQAALRTLQAFPFFKPTCLCKEPNVDPECNSFRDFLFDHPCVFVLKKEKDPYPVEALPTCNYALNVCHSEKSCAALFDTFKLACRARDGDCKMDDKDQCREAWAGLRMSPLFGCICPNNHMKKRCDRIFAMVNHNPCVVNAVSQDGKRLPPSIGSGNRTSHSTDSNQNKENNENNWVSGVDLGPEEGFELDDHHISPHIMEEGHRRIFGRPGRRKGGTHHWKHQDGPKRIGSNDEGHDGNAPRISLKSTCQLALDRCIRDKSCTASLTPILQTCDNARCDREGCMESLRNFYRTPNVQWNLEIAFCLCKKTDNKEDACMNAQEKLHPVCAQREPGVQLPFCHVLAQTCRENPECRMRLEMYEQSCAVDSVTKRCAGSPEACRTAVLNMLGTDLRTACACKGTEYNHLYDCLGWQRLLWLNPCVVESQSDFHIKTYGSTSTPAFDNGIRTIHETSSETEGKQTTSVMIPQTTRQPSVVFVTQAPKTFVNTHEETKIGRNIEVEIVQGGNKEQEAIIVVSETTTFKTTTTTDEQTTIIITTTPSTTTTTEMETTTRTTTTSTTPEPTKYCIVQRPELDDQFVQKGHTKRLYRDAELDCSELCHCDSHLSVSCHAVCVRHAPCRTALAYYSHAAPAYQAYRGRCYCYSGSFICMRPNPGEYSLPPGVYLLLGFSSQDEALLRPHTRLGLEDAVRVLQEYMLTLADDGTNCTLTMFNVTNENMIITASVPNNQRDTPPNTPIAILDNDKMECIELLETLKSKINSQDYDISSHLLLSIFKIAEVDIIYPPPSSAAVKGPSLILILTAAFFVLFLQEKNCSILHLVRHKLEEYCTNMFVKMYCLLIVGFNIKNYIILRTYDVISIALETFAHFFYFSRDIVATALIFFHFFPYHDFNDISKIVDIKKKMLFPPKNLLNITGCSAIGNIVNWAPFCGVMFFNKMGVNDCMSKVMPSARLFYEKMCFVYTVIGTVIPRTYLALRQLAIIINVYITKHISIAVNILIYCCIISVKICIFCSNVHLESVIYSIYHTIHMSLLTYSIVVVSLLMFVVNFAKYAASGTTITTVFSSRIKTEIFLLILYQGFIGVQDGEIIDITILIITDCLQNIFLNNILHIGTMISLLVVCTVHAAVAILSSPINKMASHFIEQLNLTYCIVSFYTLTSLLTFTAMFNLFKNNAFFVSDDVLVNDFLVSYNISPKHCEYMLTGVAHTREYMLTGVADTHTISR